MQCPNPVVLPHTELMNAATVYVFGNMLTFHCEEGYEAYGVMTSRCLANGKWSRVRGKCARKYFTFIYAHKFVIFKKIW